MFRSSLLRTISGAQRSSLRSFPPRVSFSTEPIRVRLPEDEDLPTLVRSIPKWFKKEGDLVKAGEPICEVDTGEVVFDFNSPVAGYLVKITAEEGSKGLKSGEVIAYLAGSQDQITSVKYAAAKEISLNEVEVHLGTENKQILAAEALSSPQDLGSWLSKLGGEELAVYAPRLTSEGFTSIEALKTLDEEDLDSLKIDKRGHRKLLLAGVKALKE